MLGWCFVWQEGNELFNKRNFCICSVMLQTKKDELRACTPWQNKCGETKSQERMWMNLFRVHCRVAFCHRCVAFVLLGQFGFQVHCSTLCAWNISVAMHCQFPLLSKHWGLFFRNGTSTNLTAQIKTGIPAGGTTGYMCKNQRKALRSTGLHLNYHENTTESGHGPFGPGSVSNSWFQSQSKKEQMTIIGKAKPTSDRVGPWNQTRHWSRSWPLSFSLRGISRMALNGGIWRQLFRCVAASFPGKNDSSFNLQREEVTPVCAHKLNLHGSGFLTFLWLRKKVILRNAQVESGDHSQFWKWHSLGALVLHRRHW